MRALKILIVVMGVLIVAGVAVVIVTITGRIAAPNPAAAVTPAALDEPEGTRIGQITASGDRLVLLLQGGGADRIVVMDLRQGRVVTRMGLSPAAPR